MLFFFFYGDFLLLTIDLIDCWDCLFRNVSTFCLFAAIISGYDDCLVYYGCCDCYCDCCYYLMESFCMVDNNDISSFCAFVYDRSFSYSILWHDDLYLELIYLSNLINNVLSKLLILLLLLLILSTSFNKDD